MASKHTPAEIERRVLASLPPLVVVDRRNQTDGTDLILSIQDIVGRVLNSDIDAVHYLVGMQARNLASLCGKILVILNNLERQAIAASQETPSATSRIQELSDLMSQIQSAGKDVRPALVREFDAVATAYARSGVERSGRVTTGIHPAIARESVVSLLEDLQRHLSELSDNVPSWLNWFRNYQAFDVTSATEKRVALYGSLLLSKNFDLPSDQQSEGIIDALVVSAMLQLSVTRLDVLQSKYAGTPVFTAKPPLGQEDVRSFTLETAQPLNLPIRSGDLVLARTLNSTGVHTVVGVVYGVVGLVVRVRVTDPAFPAQVSGTHEVLIRSQGLHTFDSARPVVNALYGANADLLTNPADFIIAARTYAESGSRSGAYSKGLTALRSGVMAIRTSLQTVRSSRVAAVDSLLEHLASERLELVVGALTGLQFELLEFMPDLLSSQTTIEHLVEQLQDDMDATSSSYTVAELDSQFEDYFRVG
jgi:hypothetical protein